MKKIAFLLLLVLLGVSLFPYTRSFLTEFIGEKATSEITDSSLQDIAATSLSPTPEITMADQALDALPQNNPDDLAYEPLDDLSLDGFETSDSLLEEDYPNTKTQQASLPETAILKNTDPLSLSHLEKNSDSRTADLAVTIGASDRIANDVVSKGETQFFAEVTNHGPDIAQNVIVEIFYGDSRGIDFSVLPRECVNGEQKISCLLNSITPQKSHQFVVGKAAATGIQNTPISLNAAAYFEGIDLNVFDNTDSYRHTSESAQNEFFYEEKEGFFAAGMELIIPDASAAARGSELLARGLIMPVFAVDESPEEKNIIPEIAVNPKVAQPEEALIFILTVTNRSQTQFSKVHATVFYPFDYLDLETASEPYSFIQEDDAIDFVKPTLNPGERWLIRINGKVKNAAAVIADGAPRTIVNSFTIKAEEPRINDDFASTQVLIVVQKENKTDTPDPSASPTGSTTPNNPSPSPVISAPSAPMQSPDQKKDAPIISLPDSGQGSVLFAAFIASIVGGLFAIRRFRRRTSA